MKIKEKGLTGKTADMRKESIASRKGFNAFKEMEDEKKGKGQKSKDHAKREIWLEFMGSKIRVQEEDGGSVKSEEIPYIKGATLKFTGCGGDANFTEMKVVFVLRTSFDEFLTFGRQNPLRERFARVPYIQFSKGDDFGLIGFDKALTEDEIDFVKTNLKTINSKEVQWSIPEGIFSTLLIRRSVTYRCRRAAEEDEKQFQIDRANFAARSALSRSQDRSGSSRGGRGGGRGGRGGRGGARGGRGRGRGGGRSGGDRNGERDKDGKASEEQSGEKRKRAVEPDGGPDTGVRGQAIPTIAPSKKAKTDATS
jgi:lupus La protein